MYSIQNLIQLENYNGVPLAGGKVYVYHQGRTELATIYSDYNGATPIANPATLDALGMQEIYVSQRFNYTVVVTDPYGNELFSRDIHTPINSISGSGLPYEGIYPINVDNTAYSISADTIPFGIQEPLYFVKDDAEGMIIGMSGETDWTNTITAASAHAYNEATAQIPTDYATTAQLADKLDTAIYAADSGNFLTAHQSLPQSADWDSTYTTVSNKSASWTGGAGGGLPMNISDSAVFDSGFIDDNQYSPGLYLSGNMYNYPSIQVRGGYNIEGESGSLNSNYLSFHTGYTMLSNKKQVLQLSRDGISGNGTNNVDWYFRPYEYGLLTGTYDTVSNNSANWGGGSTYTGDAQGALDEVYLNSANWLTGVPAGTMNESNFGYDASNNITAYNGSAFKAGDEFPQSATEAIEVVTGGSANWNSTTATVSTNSGAWGGSGIEISAGFGIDIQMVDNKLLISLATATGDI